MHITLNKKIFLDVLSRQQSVVSKRTITPVLAHVHFKTLNATTACLTGTNLDLTLVEEFPLVSLDLPGEMLMPAVLLHDIVKKCPENLPIVLKQGDNKETFCLSCGKSTFNIPLLPVEQFPPIVMHPLPHRFVISAERLRALMEHTRFAMSPEEGRYATMGIYMHAVDNILRCTATDAKRLAMDGIDLPQAFDDKTPGVILGRKLVHELVKILPLDAEVECSLSPQQICIKFESVTLYARLIEGRFPQYDRVIQRSDQGFALTLPRKTFAQAVDRISMVLSQEAGRMIRFCLKGHLLTLSGYSPEYGFATEELEVQGTTLETTLDLGFNPRHLLDVCQRLSQDTLHIHGHNDTTPVHFYGETLPLYVIMPSNLNPNTPGEKG